MTLKTTGRETIEYKEFRDKVRKRDNYTCQMCYKRYKKVYVHHIIQYAKSAYLRLNTYNAICLCYLCHKKVTGRENFYIEELSKKAIENELKYNSR